MHSSTTRCLVAAIALAITGCASSPDPSPRAGSTRSFDGVELRYDVAGHGEPALVFVHGWCCDRSFWKEQITHFGRRHRVVALDLAGHGESGRERRAWTMASFGRDVVALCDALELQHVVLVGHSMGGPVVLEAAKLLGDRVVGIVPVDTLHDVERRMSEAEIARAVDGHRPDFRASCDTIVRRYLFNEDGDPALVDRVAQTMSSAPPEIAVPAMEDMFRDDLAAAIAAVPVPIRCINAAGTPTKLDAARRHHADFDVVTMTGVGHFLMLEDPATFDRLLAEIVAQLR